MRIIRKISILVLSVLLLASMATAEEQEESQSNQLITTISSKVAAIDDENITELWRELSNKGYVAKIGKDEELRYQFVMLQGIIEKSICELLKNKHLLKSKIAIITPAPSTPLRKTQLEIEQEKAQAKTQSESLVIKTIEYRHEVLVNDYLANKLGTLIAVYNKSAFKNESTYSTLAEKYKENLIDKPVMDIFAEKLTGANYKLIDKYNNNIFISFQSYQFFYPRSNKKYKWAIWFGYAARDSDSDIDRRQQVIDDYLESIGVPEFKR